ncbi:N-formylglutamate amidohydrolase [Candidatus Hydrogenedentota bacterium]
MSKLPILISLPHAGLEVPPELDGLNLLTPAQIARDGDVGASDIYDLGNEVIDCVRTPIARAFVDVNRPENDFRKDGVVKTHTCWDEVIYERPLPEPLIKTLLDKYYRPYHDSLAMKHNNALLGLDCHTMAEKGPPVGPDQGEDRPFICLSNADHTCPDAWLKTLAETLIDAFSREVRINDPFLGGHIVREHCGEMPWIQIEFNRTDVVDSVRKREVLVRALTKFIRAVQ